MGILGNVEILTLGFTLPAKVWDRSVFENLVRHPPSRPGWNQASELAAGFSMLERSIVGQAKTQIIPKMGVSENMPQNQGKSCSLCHVFSHSQKNTIVLGYISHHNHHTISIYIP